jgi:hypothetical protein
MSFGRFTKLPNTMTKQDHSLIAHLLAKVIREVKIDQIEATLLVASDFLLSGDPNFDRDEFANQVLRNL